MVHVKKRALLRIIAWPIHLVALFFMLFLWLSYLKH